MHETLSDHERRTIEAAARWLSGVLHDARHTASNVTRLERLYQGSSLELDGFMILVKRAHSTWAHKQNDIRNPAPYFFTVLESLIIEPVAWGELPY
jgi:hypothetical protein